MILCLFKGASEVGAVLIGIHGGEAVSSMVLVCRAVLEGVQCQIRERFEFFRGREASGEVRVERAEKGEGEAYVVPRIGAIR